MNLTKPLVQARTKSLIRAPLNWAVAQCWCEGGVLDIARTPQSALLRVEEAGTPYHFDEDWRQGGWILQMADIDIVKEARTQGAAQYTASKLGSPLVASGPTRLVAGLRCYLLHELGERVEVPAELLAVDVRVVVDGGKDLASAYSLCSDDGAVWLHALEPSIERRLELEASLYRTGEAIWTPFSQPALVLRLRRFDVASDRPRHQLAA